MTIDELKNKWIGQRIMKKTLKPFKYGGKIGTVKDVVTQHPYKGNVIAFQIAEDDTFVEAWRCYNHATLERGPRDLKETSEGYISEK